ncbi:MAG: hypothetical protein WBX15_05755 [Thermoanaerobaculia bacterium]
MPQAYGRDRVAGEREGVVLLDSAAPKSWVARRDRKGTRSEFPGSAVLWDGSMYEVAQIEPLPSGSVRYVLAPWDERHIARYVETYDVTTERFRIDDRADVTRRERFRRGALFAAPLVGLLPGRFQQAMSNEIGVPPLAMTVWSAIPLLLFGGVALIEMLTAGMGGYLFQFPVWLSLLGCWFFVESLVRLTAAWSGGIAVGSLIGFVATDLWLRPYQFLRSRVQRSPSPSVLPDGISLADDAKLMEPFFALFTPDEQRLLASRFGWDPIPAGKMSAAVIGAFALAGLISAVVTAVRGEARFSILLSALIAVAVLVEQWSRWVKLARNEPAGSVFGRLFRPLAKGLLAGNDKGGSAAL